ncbi:MAG: uracil-DNA glycosylase [Candidatus Contendobacter odensis]|uniref:Type-4 uracil-DNA glycosylase n=1 Tax=Candidatus Contendibacter odensensis TaxID=1400860 RepID=A0A2G6PGX4_9GAMM|nr:MAG: uracil-DNA glycosylase [Candidatus Contendobacter odensis]
MMLNDRKRQYLHAMGIPLWLPRRPPASQPEPDSIILSTPPEQPKPLAVPEPGEMPATTLSSPQPDSAPNLSMSQRIEETQAKAMDDREMRIATMDWEALNNSVRQCDACGLCTTRSQTVFGVGNRQADWLVIGEAPGADEDRLGEPFVGRAGKLLDSMLLAIGLKRKQIFITNILKCRPPQNRDPNTIEVECCRPFLERQIELVQPRIILAIGRIAAQNLLETQMPIGKLRGQVHHFGQKNILLIVTYHPAYLLRSPREKRKSWDDLRLARRVLRQVTATQ